MTEWSTSGVPDEEALPCEDDDEAEEEEVTLLEPLPAAADDDDAADMDEDAVDEFPTALDPVLVDAAVALEPVAGREDDSPEEEDAVDAALAAIPDEDTVSEVETPPDDVLVPAVAGMHAPSTQASTRLHSWLLLHVARH